MVNVKIAAFYWHHEELSGMLLMHFNNFFWGGTERFENVAIPNIKNNFQFREQKLLSDIYRIRYCTE